MNKVNLLLASSNRGVNSQVQAMVLDVCYDQALVHCVPARRVDEFVGLGSRESFHLIVVAPNNLFSQASRGTAWADIGEVVRGVAIIRGERATPIVAVAVSPEHEFLLLEAGATATHGFPLKAHELKPEFRRALGLQPLSQEILLDRKPAPPRRWSWATLFSKRGRAVGVAQN